MIFLSFKHRERAKLSLREVGQRAKMPHNTIHSIEIGRTELNRLDERRLARVLGTTMIDEINKVVRRRVGR